MSKTNQELIQYSKEPYIEDVGPRRIKSICFSTFAEDDIYKMAAVQVYKGVYYDAAKKPIDHGLLDPHMGPPGKTGVCATCEGEFTQCPGHYGFLNLSLPVYNVGYLATIVDILKCICKSCSRTLLPEEARADFLKKMRNSKMEPLKKTELSKRIVKKCTAMASSKKAVKCSRCGYINGMVKKATGTLGVIHDRSRVMDNTLDDCTSAISHMKDSKASINVSPFINPARVLSLFKMMLEEDCELLYLSDRPEKLMVTNIAVPPIAVRPSVFVDGGTQSQYWEEL